MSIFPFPIAVPCLETQAAGRAKKPWYRKLLLSSLEAHL